MPSLRAEFNLSFIQVGLLLSVPILANTFLEPLIMLLGDTRFRKYLVVAGGIGMAVASIVFGSAWAFPVLLAGEILFHPASAAFVSLSQATLMDLSPGRQEKSMARWTAAGSLGNLLGPLILADGLALSFGWRWMYLAFGAAGILLVLLAARKPFPLRATNGPDLKGELIDILKSVWDALRNLRLLRWIILLELADLLLDVFTSFLALYFTETQGFSAAQAGLVMGVYIAASLAADFLVIYLLDRIPGRRLVRITSAIMLVAYPLFLLAPWTWLKLVLLMVLPFCHMGWYPVLEGSAYAEIPGRSATVKVVGSLGGLLAAGLAFAVSAAAQAFTLSTAMWLLLLGPLALVIGCRHQPSPNE
jgi:FSR family fosmidomycin resistance protein-like MFS transporter